MNKNKIYGLPFKQKDTSVSEKVKITSRHQLLKLFKSLLVPKNIELSSIVIEPAKQDFTFSSNTNILKNIIPTPMDVYACGIWYQEKEENGKKNDVDVLFFIPSNAEIKISTENKKIVLTVTSDLIRRVEEEENK